MPHRIGVCSWSLRASGPEDLVRKLALCDLNAAQVALDPIRSGEWPERETIARLNDSGVTMLSGMMRMAGEDYSTLESIRMTGGVRSDDHWLMNLDAARANAELAARLGMKLVTFHAGFLPDDRSDPLRMTMIDRLRKLADVFTTRGVHVAFETGQETAGTLVDVLDDLDRPAVGLNFDPANMILYGMGEPVTAIERLSPWVKQIHIKDALPSQTPGTWGTETRAGDGAVNWPKFFAAVEALCPRANLVIEREAREERLDDIRAARDLIMRSTRRPAEQVHG
jgi:sugar phosphate isomerase/epimerase